MSIHSGFCDTSRLSAMYLDSAIYLDCLRYISTVCLLSTTPFCGAHDGLIRSKRALYVVVCNRLFSDVNGETGVPVRGH